MKKHAEGIVFLFDTILQMLGKKFAATTRSATAFFLDSHRWLAFHLP
jgi:hypothetical protein